MAGLSQENFQETPYQDQAWEVVGAPPSQVTFEPLPIPVTSTQEVAIDPLFADYGGCNTTNVDEIVHSETLKKAVVEQEILIPRVSFTEEEYARALHAAEVKGRTEATAEVTASLTHQHEELTSRMSVALQDLTNQVDIEFGLLEKRAVEVALELARRLTFETVEINPEYISRIIAEALSLTGGALVKRILVSPQDKEFIDIVGVDKKTTESLEIGWEFVGDPTIKSGCVVETSAGNVDLQLDKAWERYREKVLKVVS